MPDANFPAGTATGFGFALGVAKRVPAQSLKFIRAKAYNAFAKLDPVAQPPAGTATGAGFPAVAKVGVFVLAGTGVANGNVKVATVHLARVGEDFARATARGVALRAYWVVS